MLVEEIEETNNGENTENTKNTVDPEKAKEQIKKCMLLLQRHTKDEEKFVALLILPKLLNPNDKELMSIVFRQIDFVFLRRLLISDNSDNNSESQSSLYKIISLNIISSFCYYTEFLNDKRMIKTIPYLISILNENEDLEVTLEILDIFILFTTNEKTLREISIPESIERINNLIINSNHDEIKDKSIKILLFLCQSEYCNSIITIIPKLSEYFIKNNSEIKFRILELFVALFTNISLNNMKLPDDNQWLSNIIKALKIILSNKLGSSQNDNCLILISNLVRMKGVEFFFLNDNVKENGEFIKNDDKKIKLMDNIQFLTLVAHLACTETRVLLDDYKDEDDLKEINLKEEEKLKIIDIQKRIQEMLPICFEIIEFIINILVQYSEYDNENNMSSNNEIYNILKKNNINSKWILSLREALSETILALMEFITEKTQMYEETKNIEKIDNAIVLLSTRILSSWLSEDIEMFQKESLYIIPALIEIAKIKPKSIDIIPMNNISLVFSEITTDENYQKEFIKNEGIKVLFYFLENNSDINSNTLLNIFVSLINIVMLNQEYIKSHKLQWKELIQYYKKYNYTKDTNITIYSYLIVLELSILRLIDSECTSEDEREIIENSIDYIIKNKDTMDDSIKDLWNLSFSIFSELSENNINVGKISLLNTAKLVSLTKDSSLSDAEKGYLNKILNSIRNAAKN